jgi:hypothetical protein
MKPNIAKLPSDLAIGVIFLPVILSAAKDLSRQ